MNYVFKESFFLFGQRDGENLCALRFRGVWQNLKASFLV